MHGQSLPEEARGRNSGREPILRDIFRCEASCASQDHADGLRLQADLIESALGPTFISRSLGAAIIRSNLDI
jgi:hypothetical protein